MKRPTFTESQIIGMLKEQEQRKKVANICPEHDASCSTFPPIVYLKLN